MPRKNKILIRTGTGAPTAADFVTSEPAWDSSNKKFYVKAADGSMVEIGAGGGGTAEIYEYATTASFPATGAAATLYIATDYGRIYRWVDATTKYVEVGSLGGDGSLWSSLVPTAPTNLSGSIGGGQVTLTWTAPQYSASAITDYAIQYSSNSGSSWTTWSHSALGNVTTATVTGLTNGTAYIFRAAAINALGTGSYSSNSASYTPVAGDSSYSSVTLLLHADGTVGSTTYTDSSSSPLTVTATATISSTQSKFGGTSAYLSGSANLSIPYGTGWNFGSGDWTIEWWQYWTGGNVCWCWSTDVRLGVTGNYGAATGNKLCLWASSNGSSWDILQGDSGGGNFGGSSVGATQNAWQHIAIQRAGSAWQMFFDGTRVLNYTSSASLASASGMNFLIGGPWGGAGPSRFQGYMDEFRVTKGVARYTTSGNFTAPTAAFPNYA